MSNTGASLLLVVVLLVLAVYFVFEPPLGYEDAWAHRLAIPFVLVICAFGILENLRTRVHIQQLAGALRTLVGRSGAEATPEVKGEAIGHNWSRYEGEVDLAGLRAHHFRERVLLDAAVPGGRLVQRYISELWTDGRGRPLRVEFRAAVSDVRSAVDYRTQGGGITAISRSEEIREVENAGQPDERLLPAGRDSGYLWRAHTLTHFAGDEDGVFIVMETLGLSRRFPFGLGWIIEPIARRLGRKSVEGSLNEFVTAIRRSAGLTASAPLCA